MTVFWVAISILGFFMWLFSMCAAFLLGQAVFARAAMSSKVAMISELRLAWSDFVYAMKGDEHGKD